MMERSRAMRSFARTVQLQCTPSRAEITPFFLHQYELFPETQCTLMTSYALYTIACDSITIQA